MTSKAIRRFIIVGIIIAVIIIVTQIIKNRPVEEEPPLIRPVKTLVVEDSPSRFERVFPGKLQASQSADLAFVISGELIDFPVKEGDKLKRGDLIARLNSEDAQSMYDSAYAKFKLAESEFKRKEELYKAEVISKADYETYMSNYQVALAELNNAKKSLEDTELRAPFEGIVAKRFVDQGETVRAGQTVVTFMNPSAFDITIDVPESLVHKLKYYYAKVTAEFPNNPGKSYPLTIKEYATVADPYTNTYALTYSMPQPDDFTLLPNMTVNVKAEFVRREDIMQNNGYILPASAVVYNVDNKGPVVWVVDKNTMTVKPKPVVLPENSNQIENGDIIISEGLETGDIAVIAGGNFLEEGQKVRLMEQK